MIESAEFFAAAIGGSAAGGAAAYYAAKERINVALARVEEQLKAVRSDVDSDHARLEAVSKHVYSRGMIK